MREPAVTGLFRRATRVRHHCGAVRAAAAALAAASLFLPATAFGVVPPPRAAAARVRSMPRAAAKRTSAAGPPLAPLAAAGATGGGLPCGAAPRIELFFKSDAELRERVRLLSGEGYAAFSLVNKNNDDKMVEWLDACLAEAPHASVCVHYSLKYNKDKAGAEATFKRFLAHLQALDARGYGQRAEVLLISGSGPKTPLDTVTCLEKLARERSSGVEQRATQVGVAFNPYYEDGALRELERSRLQKKLASRQVHTVWLQFGSDTALLQESLQWLTRELAEDIRPRRIVGSLFLPTKQLIAQQRFRPWNGVFLSPEYLSGPEGAEAITKELLHIYATFGVSILVEAPGVRGAKDIALLRSLLADAPAAGPARAVGAMEAEGTGQEGNSAPTKRLRLSGGGPDTEPAAAAGAAAPKAPQLAPRKGRGGCENDAGAAGATGIVIFGHHDLRLYDNPAFAAACSHGAVVPVFIWCAGEEGDFEPGRALQVYLVEAIKSVEAELQARGLRLVLRSGASTPEALTELCKEVGASAVFYNRDATPAGCLKASSIQRTLAQHAVSCHESRSAALLYEPEAVPVKAGFNGGHWGTLMPFLRACLTTGVPPRPVPAPTSVRAPAEWPASCSVHELGLARMPRRRSTGDIIDWGAGIRGRWPAGEVAAMAAADRFVAVGMARYESDRSRADLESATVTRVFKSSRCARECAWLRTHSVVHILSHIL